MGWNPISGAVNFVKDAFKGYTGQLQYELGVDTNRQNLELANTQVQRRKEDLIAAGMNPALAADGQGAAVTMQTPEAPNMIGGAMNAAQAILGMKQLKEAILGQQKQNNLTDSQIAANHQSMLSTAEDIKAKRFDLMERLYNFEKYKEAGVPTNASSPVKTVASIKSAWQDFLKKHGIDTEQAAKEWEAIQDSFGDNSPADVLIDSLTDKYNKAAFERQESAGKRAATKEAINNLRELEKYKRSGQAQIDRERREYLQKHHWRKGNPWD